MTPDFGLTASDYVAFRRPFAPELFERLARFGVGLPGQRVLDVGAGTSLVAAALRRQGCDVVASDASLALLASSPAARSRRVACRAEALPFYGGTFDVVTAAGCWHWFDRRVAPREIRRVLRPGGLVAALYQMHVPLPGSVAEATERLILLRQPRWRHANSAGINGQVLRDLQAHGFGGIESFSFDVVEPFTREQWRGYVRSTSAVGASMTATQVRQFDDDHAALLQDWPEPLRIPHRIFAVVARKA